MIVVPILLGVSALFVLIFGTRQSPHLMESSGGETYTYREPDQRSQVNTVSSKAATQNTGASQPTTHQSHLSDPKVIERIRAETARLARQAPIPERVRGKLEPTVDPMSDYWEARSRVDQQAKIDSGVYQEYFSRNEEPKDGWVTEEKCAKQDPDGVYTTDDKGRGLCILPAPTEHMADTMDENSMMARFGA